MPNLHTPALGLLVTFLESGSIHYYLHVHVFCVEKLTSHALVACATSVVSLDTVHPGMLREIVLGSADWEYTTTCER